MKTIVEAHQDLGDGQASESIILEGGMLKAKIEFNYPLAKALTPINVVIDDAVAKLEAAIPGDWDKLVLEPIKEELKAQIAKILSE